MATRSSIDENLSQAQRRLTEDLRTLEAAVQQKSQESMTAIRTGLGSVYTHLCAHFRLQEKGGFLNELREREPRLARTAWELLEEHRTLRQALDSLHGEANVAVSLDDTFREKVRQWIANMRRHETRENDLLQDVVDLDIGAED